MKTLRLSGEVLVYAPPSRPVYRVDHEIELARQAIRMTKASVEHWSCMRRWGHAPLKARLSCLSILNERIDKMQEEVGKVL